MQNVISLLEEYGELTAQADAIRLNVDSKRSEIMAIVQEELDALDAETIPQIQAMQKAITDLTEKIKTETLKEGQSIKGSRFHAIYTKGRTSWDTNSLDGYAVAHPEIARFKKVGEPSISIRPTRA